MIKYLLLLFLFFSSPANIFSFKALEAETKESFFESGRENISKKKYSDALDDFNNYIKSNPDNWRGYHNRAISKEFLGDFLGAIADYSKAIELNPNPWEKSFFRRGYLHEKNENYERAISDYSSAIKINPEYEEAYFFRGYLRYILEDYEGSIEDYSKVIELNPNNENAYSGRGASKNQLKDFDSAIKDFTEAININPNSYFLNWRAYLKLQIDDIKGSIIDNTNAIKLDPTDTKSYLDRAFGKYQLGDLEGAISDYEAIIDFGEPEEILFAINYLTDTYISNGIYQEVLPLINKGKSLSNNVKEKNEDYLDLFYKEAIYYGTIGDNDRAKQSLKKCLKESEKIKLENSLKTNDCKKYLADIYIFSDNNYEDAKKLFKFRSLEGQLIRSQIAFKEKNFNKAQRILKRLYDLQIKNSKQDKPDLSLSELLGYAYWWDGENNKAKIYHNQALNLYEEVFGKESHYLIQPLLNVAMVYFKEKDYEKTDYYLRRSLAIQFKYIQDQIPFLPISKREQFIKTLGISYQAIFTATDIHPLGKNLALFARLNRHGLLEEIEKKQITLASLKGSEKDLMEKIKDLTNQLSSTNQGNKKSMEKLKIQKEKLELELYKSLPQLKSKIFSLSDISKEIPDDAVLIEFQKYRPFVSIDPDQSMDENTWGDAKYQALILFPNNNVESIDLGSAAEIDQLISLGLVSSEQSLIDAQDIWHELGSKIIKPLEKYIKNKKTLFISPDSELNKVPFAAIGSFNKTDLLGDIFQLRLLTTGRELITLNEEKNLINKQSIVVANPNFNLFGKNSSNSRKKLSPKNFNEQKRSFDQKNRLWGSLPGTKKEAEIISKITNAKLFLEDEASALNIQMEESPKILHIATHSFYIGDNKDDNLFSENIFSNSITNNKRIENPLLRSGIVLAGANYPDKNLKDDGYLTALEVSKLNWNDTELVVVSGCESGQGDLQSGEGVYGLKRAIAVAGARSSLLSLWEVDDKATAEFMESFYLKLKSGESRSKALSNTQKEFREHPIKAWQHPNVWAAFQLNGDWRPINW